MALLPEGFHHSPIFNTVTVDGLPAQALASDEAGEAAGAAIGRCVEELALRTIEHRGATRVGLESQKMCCWRSATPRRLDVSIASSHVPPTYRVLGSECVVSIVFSLTTLSPHLRLAVD